MRLNFNLLGANCKVFFKDGMQVMYVDYYLDFVT